jgi:NAD(P)-dependent dehydrogenase (short-subunit alcohol dehydrogenase family)
VFGNDAAPLTVPGLILASEAGSFVTGTVLVVDGGALAKVF